MKLLHKHWELSCYQRESRGMKLETKCVKAIKFTVKKCATFTSKIKEAQKSRLS